MSVDRDITIGLYTDSYIPVVDGVATCVRNYARWLNAKHCAAYVAAPEVPNYEDDDPFPVIRFFSIPIKPHPPHRFGIPALDTAFRPMEIEHKPCLVHTHSPFSAGGAALRLAKKLDIPLVASFHSKLYDDFLQATGSEFIAARVVDYVVSFYNKADYVWTVNRSTAKTLAEYGYKGEVEVVVNGTDYDDSIDRAAACREIDERYGIRPGQKVMLFVGQIVLQKNLVRVINAAWEYANRGHDFRLFLVGEGYARDELTALVKERGLKDRVTFTGPIYDRDELKKFYARADLFVFPSIYDNAALVIREAAALCVPSIMVAGSNIAEGLTDGVNAYLCEDTDESVADAMERALGDDEKRACIGKGAKVALARSWESIVEEVYEKYLGIINSYQKKKRRSIYVTRAPGGLIHGKGNR
ncbi:MAG: glycosyltransferase [Christensenellales bacterium]|jgi:1,2-diacylglycerol 3-alpha-glucosyltransferase